MAERDCDVEAEKAKRRTNRWMADELREAQRETLTILLDKEREEREHQLELERLRGNRWKIGAVVVVILGVVALAGWFSIPVGLQWAGLDLSANTTEIDIEIEEEN